jgi:hypothetical protein
MTRITGAPSLGQSHISDPVAIANMKHISARSSPVLSAQEMVNAIDVNHEDLSGGGLQHAKGALQTTFEIGINDGTPRAHPASVTSLQFQPSTRKLICDSDAVEGSNLKGNKWNKDASITKDKNASAALGPTYTALVRGEPSESTCIDARVSHGASEKQRRDRINAMIDELRALVPAGGEGQDTAQAGDRRRSKYAVLQDTINLLRRLKITVESQRIQISSSCCDINSTREKKCAAAQPEHHQRDHALPPCDGAALDNNSTINLSVDMRNDICYVKFHALDRRGLLKELMSALHELPMDISRANISTKVDIEGRIWVTDIFELKIGGKDGNLPRISGDEVKVRLQNDLLASCKSFEGGNCTARKKRKEDESGAVRIEQNY